MPVSTTRRRGSRIAAFSLIGILSLGGVGLTSTAASAADRDESRISAPDGLFVDIGYCMEIKSLCLMQDASATDPTGVSDWRSFVNGDYDRAIVGTSVAAFPTGATLVVRNDSGETISFDPVEISQTVSDLPDTTIHLNESPGNGEPLTPVSLEPGETWTYNIKGPDYGSPTGSGQFNMKTRYSMFDLDLAFETSAGPVDVAWTANPSSSWVASIVSPTIVEGDVIDGVAHGELSFDFDYRMTDELIEWYKARESESGDPQTIPIGSSTFLPSAEGLDMPDDLGSWWGLQDYITGAETSIPGLLARYGDTAEQYTNIGVTWSDPVYIGDTVPSATFHIQNIPVSWTAGECLTFEIAGNIDSLISVWSVYGALNPADVSLDCATPGIDVRKNAEGDDKNTVDAGEHPVTVTIVNTEEDALTDFVFTDTTEAGNDVVWSQDDLDALATLVLEPGDTFTVNGTVLVEEGNHRDSVLVSASGVASGLPVEDEDTTEYVPNGTTPTPTPTPSETVTPTETPTPGPSVEPTQTPTTPAAPPVNDSGNLAFTGSSASPWLLGSAVTIVAGGIALWIFARRRTVSEE